MKQFRKTVSASDGLTLQTELNLVVKAIRMNTLSKLTYVDGEKFDALLKDVFPRVEFEHFGNDKLISALEESSVELGLKVNKRQVMKSCYVCIKFMHINYLNNILDYKMY